MRKQIKPKRTHTDNTSHSIFVNVEWWCARVCGCSLKINATHIKLSRLSWLLFLLYQHAKWLYRVQPIGTSLEIGCMYEIRFVQNTVIIKIMKCLNYLPHTKYILESRKVLISHHWCWFSFTHFLVACSISISLPICCSLRWNSSETLITGRWFVYIFQLIKMALGSPTCTILLVIYG